MRRRQITAIAVGLILVVAGAAPSLAASGSGPDRRDRIGLYSVEVFSPDGKIRRREVPEPPEQSPQRLPSVAADVAAIQVTGPSANRFDLVIVGDGYTENELDLFASHAEQMWRDIENLQPYTRYRGMINVWRVDVVSAESGVDNDPAAGVERDTALDMGFFCFDLERLLCVDEAKAQQYAANAPAADQVLALANSTKYGGAGGTVATSSGGNADAGQIVLHELGHSIGGLADEYDYYASPDDQETYTGPEPAEINISTYDAEEMAQRQAKWWRWLGAPSPDGTVVDTYEGGGYYRFGMYRPTENSLMRILGQPFNLPGREKMTVSLYGFFETIDRASPNNRPVSARSVLWVRPIDLPRGDIGIRWYLDGKLVASQTDKRVFHLDRRRLRGVHIVTVRVTDRTTFVREPEYRRSDLTNSITWQVRGRTPASIG